jgi:hypothetical protein
MAFVMQPRPKTSWLLLALLLMLPRLAVLAQPAATPLAPAMKPASLAIPTYRARLQTAVRKLRKIENRAPRHLDKVLSPLAKDFLLKRSDGETQTAGGGEWQRRIDDTTDSNTNKPNVATRAQVVAARRALELRIGALDAWNQTGDAAYQPAANAGDLVQQLENTGQIRTGPSRPQQFWADVARWFGERFERLMNWLGSLFPQSQTRTQAPKIDPLWIKIFFTLSVLALLGVVAFLVWRAIGGRWRTREARREVRFEGEDADLLQLPPDELTDRASRFAAEGNFREALRHLYIAMLLLFDQRGIWRYDTRRTNWEHIAALRGAADQSLASAVPSLVPLFSDLTRRFDRVRYGNAPCTAGEWERFSQDAGVLRSQLQNAKNSEESTSDGRAVRR